MQPEINNLVCESLSYVESKAFYMSEPAYLNQVLPFSESVNQALALFPAVASCAVILLIILIRFMPRSDSKAWRPVVITTWLLLSGTAVTLSASYWLVPKAAEGLWRAEKHSLIEPSLSGISEAANAIADRMDIEHLDRWAAFLRDLYDYHTARLLREHGDIMSNAETLELLDTVIHTRHIQQRLSSGRRWLGADALAQIDIMAGTAHRLSHDAFLQDDLELALKIALQGYNIIGIRPYLDEVVYPIRGEMAHRDLTQGKLQHVLEHVFSIPASWRNPNYLRLIEAAQYTLMNDYLSGNNSSRWQQIIEVSNHLQDRYVTVSEESNPSVHITCNISYVHALLAVKQINDKQPLLALDNLRSAKRLVHDSVYVDELMPIAHYNMGADYMADSLFHLAASSFESAYELEPSMEFACDTSAALRQAAFKAASSQRLEYAKSSAKKAERFCPNAEEDRDLGIQIEFYTALEHQKHGNWGLARIGFKKLLNVPGIGTTARYFYDDVPSAKARHEKLVKTRHILSIPTTSGQLCSEFFEQNGQVRCTSVSLYNEGKEIGRSLPGSLTDVTFNRPGGYLAVYRNFSDRLYDTWEETNQGITKQWIDMDGDYRPDFLQTLAEGRNTGLRQLSGKISMRFVGGLVNKKGVDWFSRPDIFLVAEKNGAYFGRTETSDNNTRPSWRNYFVFDYKYRDNIEIFALDEDLFSNEFVDYMKFTELPTSGYEDMKNGNITLAIEVVPSERPEGQYKGGVTKSVFDNPSFLDDLSPIGEKVLRTYEEDARAQIMATAASIAIPEAGILVFMKRARFLEKLTAHWFGHSVVYETINQSEADKQEVTF